MRHPRHDLQPVRRGNQGDHEVTVRPHRLRLEPLPVPSRGLLRRTAGPGDVAGAHAQREGVRPFDRTVDVAALGERDPARRDADPPASVPFQRERPYQCGSGSG